MERLQQLASEPLITSAIKLWTRAKEENLGLRKKQVVDFWKNRASTQIVRGQPASTQSIPIRYAFGSIGGCQIDLMDISKYSGYNKRKKFLLNGVDITSRYAWSFPIANKKPVTILPHIKKIVSDYRNACEDCQITFYADDGREFMGSVTTYLKKESIPIVRTQKKQNQALVERFNQTLWKILNISYFANDNFRFVDEIPKLVEGYNKQKHSHTRVLPLSVFQNKAVPQPKARPKVEDNREVKIGDYVRRQVNRSVFDKGSASVRFSSDVYQVVDKVFNRFKLKNVDTGDMLKDTYLARELSFTSAPKSSSTRNRSELTTDNRVQRRNQREPSRLLEDEKVRLKPRTSKRKTVLPIALREFDTIQKRVYKKRGEERSKRAIRKPVRFRGEGIRFYD